MHLDLHTGLGTGGGPAKLLIDNPLSAAQRERLGRWFGPDSFEVAHAQGMAYSARGSFGPWCAGRSPGRDYLFATAEFGTYAPTRVLAGLRAENQAEHWAGPEARQPSARSGDSRNCSAPLAALARRGTGARRPAGASRDGPGWPARQADLR